MIKTLSIGVLLARKAIARTSLVSKLFIIVIMAMTFLNLLVVRGVLVGIPDSSMENIRADEVGDVIISRLEGADDIERTTEITQTLDNDPRVRDYSARYRIGATIESDYSRSKKEGENASKRSVVLFGIDPEGEEAVTQFSRFVIAGRFIRPGDAYKIVLGKGLVATYSSASENFTDEELLQNVDVGSKVLVTTTSINGVRETAEYEVVGISSNKGQADNRAYISDRQSRLLLGKTNPDAAEIAVRLNKPADTYQLAAGLLEQFSDQAKVETYQQATGAFLDDIKTIFDYLSGFIGVIGVLIASITIFIVIFINAMSRRKEIGIMRAIGVQPSVITISYILQSVFYAVAGILLALIMFWAFIEPYFRNNPIDFPFTDVYLATSVNVTLVYVGILGGAAFLAGLIPARLIMKQKILALILGR